MNNVGIVFRGRNSRLDKQTGRRIVAENDSSDTGAFASGVPKQSPGGSTRTFAGIPNMTDNSMSVGEWTPNLWHMSAPKPTPVLSSEPSQPSLGLAGISNVQPNNPLWMTPDSFQTSQEPFMEMPFKNNIGVNIPFNSSNNNTGDNEASPGISDMSINNCAVLDTPVHNVTSVGPTNAHLNGTFAFSSPGQDLSLLTKPVNVQETSMKHESSAPTSPASPSTPSFTQAKAAVRETRSSSITTDFSTKQLLDFCLSHDMNKSSLLPHRSASVSSVSGVELGNSEDILCICILDPSGSVAYRAKNSYYPTLEALYHAETHEIELPGGSHMLASSTNKSGTKEMPDMFPLHSRSWEGSDYFKLGCEASSLLKVSAVNTLIHTAMNDLETFLPFIQPYEIEECVTNLVKARSASSWSPLQVRQKTSLLLLLCALGSSLRLSVSVPMDSKRNHSTALPWEFGHRCFLLARGLLCPRQLKLQSEEMTMEFIQCMILVHMYMIRCNDREASWSPLAYGGMALKHACQTMHINQSDVLFTQSMLRWEMTKRCMWVLYIQEATSRIEGYLVSPRCLWTYAPLSIELPVYLHGIFTPEGRADDAITSECMNRFNSQIELCQIFVRALQMKLHENAPVSQEQKNAAISLQNQLTEWALKTPCLAHVTAESDTPALPSKKWAGSEALDSSNVYVLCSYLLSRATSR